MHFGALVRSWRERRGISVVALAHQRQCSDKWLRQLEKRETPPSVSTLLKLADALDCDLVIGMMPRDGSGEPL